MDVIIYSFNLNSPPKMSYGVFECDIFMLQNYMLMIFVVKVFVIKRGVICAGPYYHIISVYISVTYCIYNISVTYQ